MDIQTDTQNKSNQTIVINTANITSKQKTIIIQEENKIKYYNNIDWSKLTWTLQNL